MLLMDEPYNPTRDVPNAAQSLASDFARKWTSYQGNEVQHFQAHFNELCEIVGHENPHDDLDNHDFEFNQRVRTATGGQGEADVFLRDHFIMEYKKPGLDLDAAYNQNLRYRDGLGNPPLLIVADFETIRIHNNFTGKAPRHLHHHPRRPTRHSAERYSQKLSRCCGTVATLGLPSPSLLFLRYQLLRTRTNYGANHRGGGRHLQKGRQRTSGLQHRQRRRNRSFPFTAALLYVLKRHGAFTETTHDPIHT